VTTDDGEDVEFESADTLASRWTCTDIVRGRTYPHLAFVDDVQVVFDVGANCGAASVHFARHYPAAAIHAFEPGSQARGYLERNVADLRNVEVHPFGLHAVDQQLPLFINDDDIGQGSVVHHTEGTPADEMVVLRAAGPWADVEGITRIDVLKIDVEGCEVDVVESLRELLPTVKVLYVEYDSRDTARFLERAVDATHELFAGAVLLDQGEVIYVRKDYADRDGAREQLAEIMARRVAARA
jgi:FkbM family methyltransferase